MLFPFFLFFYLALLRLKFKLKERKKFGESGEIYSSKIEQIMFDSDET